MKGVLTGLRWWQVSLIALIVWTMMWSLFRGPQPTLAPPLPDFTRYEDVRELKQAFYEYLRPVVERENDRILTQREQLQTIGERLNVQEKLSGKDRKLLKVLVRQYRLDPEGASDGQLVNQLLQRVDIVPVELALVQAAKESGWGRSRFAVEANNLFGQWCYTAGCGMVPERRGAGARHEVQKFESVDAAIADYMLNLNSHPSYQPMRAIRSSLRREGQQITGLALAPGLLKYSQRREAYVQELKAMIQQYRRFQKQSAG